MPTFRYHSIAAFAAVLFASTPALYAQEHLDTAGRYFYVKRTYLPAPSIAARAIYFRDSLNGYIDDSWYGSPLVRVTTDGGSTWHDDTSGIPVPFRTLSPTFSYGSLGPVSTDGGTSWRPVSADTALVAMMLTALDERHLATLVRWPSISAWYNVQRLRYTTDAGVSWAFVDDVLPGKYPRINPSTPFGNLPAPPGMTRPVYQWRQIGAWVDGAQIRAVLDVNDTTDDTVRAAAYIVTFDLRSSSLEAVPLPLNLARAQFLDAEFLYELAFRPSWMERQKRPYSLHLSTDGGRTWDSVPVPDWVYNEDFQMLDRQRGYSTNAFTTDAGRTWQPITHTLGTFDNNVENGVRVSTPDCRHFFILSLANVFARSSDSGKTWQRTDFTVLPRCAASSRGRVLFGRDFHSILYSADSAEHWVDLGALGHLPTDLMTVWGLCWPDSANEPDRAIGIASFLRRDRSYEIRMIESSDGGQTWREAARVPEAERYLSSVENAKLAEPRPRFDPSYARSRQATEFLFVKNTNGIGSTGFMAIQSGMMASTDGGRTWQMRCDTLAFSHVAMASELRGLAATTHTVSREAAIYATSDGGYSWRFSRTLRPPGHWLTELAWLGADRYCAISPDPSEQFTAYKLTTTDGGRSWSTFTSRRAGPYLRGSLLWIDTNDLHAIPAVEYITHSTDGGEEFSTLHKGLVERQPVVITTYDGTYIYSAASFERFTRWRVAQPWRHRESGIADQLATAPIEIAPNPANEEATLQCASDPYAEVVVEIRDALGRFLRSTAARTDSMGMLSLQLDLAGLPSGAMFLLVRAPHSARTLPLLIAR